MTSPPMFALDPRSTFPKMATACPPIRLSTEVLPTMETTCPTTWPSTVEDPMIDTTDTAFSPAARWESWPIDINWLFRHGSPPSGVGGGNTIVTGTPTAGGTTLVAGAGAAAGAGVSGGFVGGPASWPSTT